MVPGRDDKDGLMLPVPDVLQRPNTKEQLAIALLSFPFSFKSIFFLFQKLMLLLLFQLLTMAQTALFLWDRTWLITSVFCLCLTTLMYLMELIIWPLMLNQVLSWNFSWVLLPLCLMRQTILSCDFLFLGNPLKAWCSHCLLSLFFFFFVCFLYNSRF